MLGEITEIVNMSISPVNWPKKNLSKLGNLVIEKLEGLQIHNTFPHSLLFDYQITQLLNSF
jgi:hypothetical protein